MEFTAPVICIVMAVVLFTLERQELNDVRNDLQRKLATAVVLNAQELSSPLWNVDRERAAMIANTILNDPDYLSITVYDEDNIVFYSETSSKTGNFQIFSAEAKIVFENRDASLNISIGRLVLTATDDRYLLRYHSKLISNGILVFGIIIIILLTIYYSSNRIICAPLESMMESIEGTKRHKATEINLITGTREFDEVIFAYNEMLKNQWAFEAELSVARENAESANLAKSMFLANMSHEIRTPISGVLGLLEVLSHSDLSNDDHRLVETMRRSGSSLLGVINDILDFSKIEAGKMDILTETMCLEDEIDHVCGLLDRMAVEGDVRISLYVDPEIPTRIKADALRIRQVLTNIINNSVKFSSGLKHHGMVSVRAELVEYENDQALVEISVKDNGIGMDEATRKRIFQSFEQADGTTTKRFGGTGLGLVISQNLVNLMGGKVSVQSTLDVGSTFTVRLPLSYLSVKEDESPSVVDGLNCAVVDFVGGLGDDYESYLTHGGARVCRATELEEAHENLSKDSAVPICFVVIGEPATGSAFAKVKGLSRLYPNQMINAILVSDLNIERGQQRTLRALSDNVFQIDWEVLTRKKFLGAVAVAAGRKKIETHEQVERELSMGDHLLSREEVIKQGRLILVAEDNEINRDVILRQLHLLGLRADMTSDGVEAFNRWLDGEYRLVLTDLHMPEKNGYDLTVSIRAYEKEENLRRTPIVALTANALEQEEKRCLALGMDAYLTKPVELNRLRETLEAWLSRKGGADETAPTADDGKDDKPAAAPGDEDAPAIDPTVLTRMVGDDPDFQAELIRDFLSTTEKMLLELDALYADQAGAEYGELAHRLKSSVRLLGAVKLGDIFADLEQAGKIGEWPVIEARHQEVAKALEEVKAHYASHLRIIELRKHSSDPSQLAIT